MVATFKEKLERAKAAPRPFQVVTVSLDADLASRRTELLEKIKAAEKPAKDPRLSKKSPVDDLRRELAELDLADADSRQEIRIERAPGAEWAALAPRYEARLDSGFDRGVGYNLHGLVEIEGRRWATYREGDEWLPFEYRAAVKGNGRVTPEFNEWREMCASLSGDDMQLLIDAFFELNVWEPQLRRERLGKVPAPSTSA